MALKQCPGSSTFAQPRIEIVACPDCGGDVEVWSDEADGMCPACRKPVIRKNTQACMDWCRYASQCLGDEKYKQYRTMKTQVRKQALVQAMHDCLRHDEPAKARALRTMEFAEDILCEEQSADPNVVIAAAVLGDLACPCSTAPDGGGAPGPVATVLEKLEYPNGFIKAVCAIVGREKDPADGKDINFRVVYDARLLAAEAARISGTGAAEAVPPTLLTEAGRKIMEKMKGAALCHGS